MGWFWQNPAPSKAAEGAATLPTQASPQPAQPTTAPQASSSDAAADNEMQKFLAMIQSEMSGPKPSDQSPPSAEPTTTTSSSSSWFSPRTTTTATPPSKHSPEQPPQAAGHTPSSQRISESLLPTTMSCRDAFDYAWHCHTPGSQWNAVYRYGSVRSCTELWDDFWFCMRTKGYKGEAKEAAIRAHWRAREAAKYGPGKPSSEDVWESREEKVEPGTAFRERFEGPEESDREWQLREIERRKVVRGGMGFNSDS